MENRLYQTVLKEHLRSNRQMAFVSGPRQVGKTTLCRSLSDFYLNWDNLDDRELILKGPNHLADHLGLKHLRVKPPVVLFDELHKFSKWKSFLKGFFDTWGEKVQILVTGSSRLDVYRKGGDSLMGRYFLYQMHPFGVGELVHPKGKGRPDLLYSPRELKEESFQTLYSRGGFPEPYLKNNDQFSRRWHRARLERLVREDIREMGQVQHLGQLETMVRLLQASSSRQLVYGNLAADLRVSVDTVRRWVAILEDFHLGFLLRPWFKNVSRSLRKEPKWFLKDWAGIQDSGARAETFSACHLMKSVAYWNDLGLGDFELSYVRDKDKREVDFLVVRDGEPWFLVEVKAGDVSLSPSLGFFQKKLAVPYAFQAVLSLPFVKADCFAKKDGPVVVPLRTLLSQLPG